MCTPIKNVMSFKQTHTMRVVRTIYEVGVFIHCSVEDIQKDFAQVPKGAKMIDWEDNDNDNGCIYTFELEKDVPTPDDSMPNGT